MGEWTIKHRVLKDAEVYDDDGNIVAIGADGTLVTQDEHTAAYFAQAPGYSVTPAPTPLHALPPRPPRKPAAAVSADARPTRPNADAGLGLSFEAEEQFPNDATVQTTRGSPPPVELVTSGLRERYTVAERALIAAGLAESPEALVVALVSTLGERDQVRIFEAAFPGAAQAIKDLQARAGQLEGELGAAVADVVKYREAARAAAPPAPTNPEPPKPPELPKAAGKRK